MVSPIRVVYRVTERTIEADGLILRAVPKRAQNGLKSRVTAFREICNQRSRSVCRASCVQLAKCHRTDFFASARCSVKTKVTRRRVRTVIENLIWLASRLVQHARETKLRFGSIVPCSQLSIGSTRHFLDD